MEVCAWKIIQTENLYNMRAKKMIQQYERSTVHNIIVKYTTRMASILGVQKKEKKKNPVGLAGSIFGEERKMESVLLVYLPYAGIYSFKVTGNLQNLPDVFSWVDQERDSLAGIQMPKIQR